MQNVRNAKRMPGSLSNLPEALKNIGKYDEIFADTISKETAEMLEKIKSARENI